MSRTEIIPELRGWPEPVEASRGVYTINGKDYARITSVLKMIGYGSDALMGWHEKQGKAAAIEAMRANWEWLKGLGVEQFVAAIEPEVAKAKRALTTMNQAADIGTLAHKMAENWLREEMGLRPKHLNIPVNDQSTWAFMAFQDKWRQAGYKPVRTEQFIYDPVDRVAGTIDILAESDRGLGVVDLKTSNYIVASHHVQVAKYKMMAGGWRDVRWAELWRIPKSLENFEVEVRELGDIFNMQKKVHEQKSEAQLLQAFAGALAIHRTFVEGA